MELTAEPVLVPRKEQPYVGIRKQVRKIDLGLILPPWIGDIHNWLVKRALEPVGAPFLRYLVADVERKLEVDVGIPVAESIPGEGQIIAESLPAGTYAMLLHLGHPAELENTTVHLFSWAEENSIRWKKDGSRWAGRVEWYYSDLGIEPDMWKWETELAILTEEC